MADRLSETGEPTVSSLRLLDAGHVHVFRNALDKILASKIAQIAFSEIVDGLPMKATWLEYDNWNEDHPVNVLGHEMICDGAREKARRFRDELDIYILSFPSKVSLFFPSHLRIEKILVPHSMVWIHTNVDASYN